MPVSNRQAALTNPSAPSPSRGNQRHLGSADHGVAAQPSIKVRAEYQRKHFAAEWKLRGRGKGGQLRSAGADDTKPINVENIETAIHERRRNQTRPRLFRARQEGQRPGALRRRESAGDHGFAHIGVGIGARGPLRFCKVAGGEVQTGEEDRCAQGPRTAKVRPGPF